MPSPSRPWPASGYLRLLAPLWVALVGLLALVVAGCGATTARPGAASQPTPTATAQPTHPGQGLGVRPCPGQWASAADTATGAVILTDKTPIASTPTLPPTRAASAHVGDRIQVRLPASVHWGLRNTTGGVTPLDPQGGEDAQLGVCFWNFTATAAGDATISFAGTPICDANGPCPQWARAETFTIHVAA